MLITAVAAAVAGVWWLPAATTWGEESERARAARVEAMSREQKEELLRKKQRFDGLTAVEQERMRKLHGAISSDPNSEELQETVKRYNQWLATLSSPVRAALLTIADPQERIARIKEVMQQQEEQRFRDFLPTLPQEDREAVKKWLAGQWLTDFVIRHEDAIRKNMPRDRRESLSDLPEGDERRHDSLRRSWSYQYARREPDTPVPDQKAIELLLSMLSAETRQRLTQPPMDEQAQARIRELVWAAVFSRTQVSREELLKFYVEMRADDPRRARLEGREGDALYSELLRMWNIERMERWRERSSGSGARGGESPGGKVLIKRRLEDDERPAPPPSPRPD